MLTKIKWISGAECVYFSNYNETRGNFRAAKMHSVDVKLRLEERNMAELRGLLHRSTDLTNNICGILNSFDDR